MPEPRRRAACHCGHCEYARSLDRQTDRGYESMRLTLFTDYGIRVLLVLTARRDVLVRTSDIASSFGISDAHLMKVTNALARAGWVEAVRGRNGGMRLATDPSKLTLRKIVRGAGAGLRTRGVLWRQQPLRPLRWLRGRTRPVRRAAGVLCGARSIHAGRSRAAQSCAEKAASVVLRTVLRFLFGDHCSERR
jgi:hypothetical protein